MDESLQQTIRPSPARPQPQPAPVRDPIQAPAPSLDFATLMRRVEAEVYDAA